MSARLFRVIVPVSDIDQAASFYSRVLGVSGMRVSNGRHYFDCGGVILACFDPAADGDGYTPAPNPEWLYFAVDDIKATFASCQAAGATFCKEEVHGAASGEIVTRPWGERSFYIHDPFGNKICFVDSATVFRG
ncbi:MAG: VOC family protein [Planctomycetes bacterium]|nr:VOC family protein [Planctomycetota bacterium]